VRSYPGYKYKNHTIDIKVWPAAGNRYQGSFSILCPHYRTQPVPPGTEAQLSLVHKDSRENGALCETGDDARQDAIDRAHAWIDANPPKM
jgi:hypothetical protein